MRSKGTRGKAIASLTTAMMLALTALGVIARPAIAQVTKVGNGIRVHAISVEGFSLDDLADDLDFTVPVKGLPMGLEFRSLSVSSKGVALRIGGSNLKFSG